MTDSDDGCLALAGVRIGALAAAMAHEIAGPISYLTHNLGVLERALAEKRDLRGGRLSLEEVLRHSYEGLQELRQLVDDLRILADPHGSPSAFDLREAAGVAIRLAGPMVRRRAVQQLRLCEAPCGLRTNRSLCVYLLVHLLVGASCALETSGARLALEVSRRGPDVVARVVGGPAAVPPALQRDPLVADLVARVSATTRGGSSPGEIDLQVVFSPTAEPGPND